MVSHPDVVYYDFYEAWDNPPAADESAYLSRSIRDMLSQPVTPQLIELLDKRSGILAQAAPNIGPL